MGYKTLSLLLALSTHQAGADQSLAFLDKAKNLDPTAWDIAHYNFTHPAFDTDWRKSQVLFDSAYDAEDSECECVQLVLSPSENGNRSSNRFVGGSIKSKTAYAYGRYESWIKPGKGEGVVTGFFVYSGPYYGTKHDEIDIEFLGRDTRKMNIAWFVDGILENHFVNLGFDASEAFHHYSFEWSPNALRWYVDKKLIFEHIGNKLHLPQTPGRLFANIWAADPSVAVWSGKIKRHQSAQSFFKKIHFTPLLPNVSKK